MPGPTGRAGHEGTASCCGPPLLLLLTAGASQPAFLVDAKPFLQTGALLGKHTVVDTAHCVPAGACVSLAQPCASSGGASEDETEWVDAGRGCICLCLFAHVMLLV